MDQIPVLEVIATSVADAVAAQRGGADRLEVVSAMDADGLLPDVDLVCRLRDAVTLPLRVMLRMRTGFEAGEGDLDALVRAARWLRVAGADAFVFGFLTHEQRLDLEAMRAVCLAVEPAAWTLHRAFDHAASAAQAFRDCAGLPGIDLILTAGGPLGLDNGLSSLSRRAGWQTATLRWLAGGGLRLEHVAALRRAGITQFHSGRAVRRGQRWDAPVDESLVRQLKVALTVDAGQAGG